MILDSISKKLYGTRNNLLDVCEELGVEMPEEHELSVMQCAACSIWTKTENIVVEEEIPVCTFCADMTLLRF